jgi:hypothetical protein
MQWLCAARGRRSLIPVTAVHASGWTMDYDAHAMHRSLALFGAISIACGGATPSEPPPRSDPELPELVVSELEKARGESAHAQAQALRNSALLYAVTKATCPASVDALAEAQMIPRAELDPWGQPFVVTCKDEGASIAIASSGADRKPGTADDITVDRDPE